MFTMLSYAGALARLASIRVSENRLDLAREAFVEALDVSRRLAEENPDSSEAKFAYITSLYGFADLLDSADDPLATTYYSRGLEIGQELNATDRRFRHLQAGPLARQAHILSDSRPMEALQLARKALDIYRGLAEESASPDSEWSDAWSHRLAAVLRDTAKVMLRAGNRDEALSNVDEAESIFRSLCAINEYHYGEDLAHTLYTKALLLDDKAAIPALVEALQVFITSGRITNISARICIQLVTLLHRANDPRLADLARVCVFHCLGYAAFSHSADRAEILVCAPGIALWADSAADGPLSGPAVELAQVLQIAREGDAEPELIETIRSTVQHQKAEVVSAHIAKCLAGLGVLCKQVGDLMIGMNVPGALKDLVEQQPLEAELRGSISAAVARSYAHIAYLARSRPLENSLSESISAGMVLNPFHIDEIKRTRPDIVGAICEHLESIQEVIRRSFPPNRGGSKVPSLVQQALVDQSVPTKSLRRVGMQVSLPRVPDGF